MPGTSPGMTLLIQPLQSLATCTREDSAAFDGACGADEGADHLDVLDAGRALDARGDIDAAGLRDANSLRDVIRGQAARDHERQFEREVFQHMPVEHRAQAAWPRRALGRTRIEQDAI